MAQQDSNDQLLWQEMKNGDQLALASLFKRHYQTLFDYSYKFCRDEELAKDCIQELFSYIWQRRTNLADVVAVKTYLLTAIRRELIKNLKKQRNSFKKNQKLTQNLEFFAFSPEDLLLMKEQNISLKKLIQEMLDQIPARMREVLYLKTYSSLTYQEISVVMNISPQVARNYLYEALKRMRKLKNKPDL